MKWFIIILVLLLSTALNAQSFLESVSQAQEAYKTEEFENALTLYNKAASIDNNHEHLGLELAQAAYRTNAYEEALLHYESAIKRTINPINQSEIYHNMGNASLKAGDIERAINYYKSSIKLNGAGIETKSNLSHALRMKKNAAKNNDGEKRESSSKPSQIQKNKKQQKAVPQKKYSFEAQKNKQILNDLLRKEAQTKRRLEEKRSQSSNNSKDW